MKFHTKLLASGKTATGVQVPDEIVTSLGAGRKPAICITINGHTYRSTIATMGGKFMVGVSAENRERARIAAGDEIDVVIELDNEPREVAVPGDFAEALDQHAAAKKSFDSLSYSNRLRHVLAIEGAKTADTRQRRIDKAISMLREGKA